MRTCLGVLFGLVLFALVVPGCGPALKEEELGTIVFDVFELPGSDERFDLPDLSPPTVPESETEAADES
jgi:hypothetical protein